MTDETRAWVVFTTNRPARATVEFRSTNGATRTVAESGFETGHAVLLSGLIPGLTYEGTITAVAENGDMASTPLPPFTATEPQRDVEFESPPQVFFTGPDEAVIALSTTTPSTVEVQLSRDGFPAQVFRDDTPSRTHALTLPNLLPNAMYSFIVTVRGTDGSIRSTAPMIFRVEPFERELTISEPEIFQTGEGSAFVVFTTSKPARATVEFRSTNGATRTITEADFETRHAVLLPGLIEGLTYNVRVTATSEDGDVAVAFAQPFTVTDVAREVGFEIEPQVFFTGPDQAVIVFTTNVASTAEVTFSRSGQPAQTVRETQPTRTHALTLPNLLPDQTYTFIVTVRGPDGSIASSAPRTFRVEPFERELTISKPEVFSTGEGSAFVVFTTSKPARATLEYEAPAGVTRTVSETDFDTQHVILIPDLVEGQTISGRIFATAEDGDVAIEFLSPFLFTNVPQEIGFEVQPQVLITGPNEAIVTFTTTAPATARVDFGLVGQPLNQTVQETTPTRVHALTLSGLTPNATYRFVVTIQSPDGGIVSTAPATFTVIPAEGGFKLGDVDRDDFVDVRDVVLILRFAVGILPLTPEQIEAADVDRSGRVDVTDAVRLLQMIVMGTGAGTGTGS